MKRSIMLILVMAFLSLSSAQAATVYSTFGENDSYNEGLESGWRIGDQVGSGDVATPFTINSSAYNLTSVEIAVAQWLQNPGNDVWVWILSNNNGSPGAVVETLYYDSTLPPWHTPGIIQLNSLTNPILAAGSTYWVAAGRTSDPGDDTGDLIWQYNLTDPIIEDLIYTRNPGGSWTQFGSTDWNVPAFRINGTEVPIPGAVWLLGSGLIGLVAIRRRTRKIVK